MSREIDRRLCVSCGSEIPDSKRSDAKKCHINCDGAERQRRYAEKYPERVRENWRNYAMSPKGTVTLLMNYARDRARRQEVPFKLTRKHIEEKLELGVCELSGLPIERVSPGDYRTHPFAPSLDRIEPPLGYIDSNVRLVCFAANRARSDFGDDVLLRLAQGLVKEMTK